MDKTSDIRQARRNFQLNQAARAKGWKHWSEYATAVIKGNSDIPTKKVTPIPKK